MPCIQIPLKRLVRVPVPGHPRDQRREVGSRREPRDELLDLRLAGMTRGGQELLDVVVPEVRGQHHHAGHVHAPVGDRLEDHRKPPRDPGGADPLERDLLGEVQ
ncbi:MAG: hypothetical protein K8M05_20140, partial [Deltaproteobacteria bacterium]|nr:hypothetical protein [Kofleriaceae bacterium]